MRVLICGAGGFIGGHFLAAYPSAHQFNSDIADRLKFRAALAQAEPELVINCAGKTGRPNIDWCESHRSETLHSNVVGPAVVFEECLRKDVPLVHMGSACVFSGNNDGKGFGEEHQPNAIESYYSRTKVIADELLKDFPVLVLRLRMPFDNSSHPRSLITRLRSYSHVLDVQNSMTYMPDFIRAATSLISMHATGIHHVVNPGTISPYEIMVRYQEVVDPAEKFERLSLEKLSNFVKAPRSNCTIATNRLQAAGIELRPVHEAVDVALKSLSKQ